MGITRRIKFETLRARQRLASSRNEEHFLPAIRLRLQTRRHACWSAAAIAANTTRGHTAGVMPYSSIAGQSQMTVATI
jgi:hypothetical protein